MKNYQEFMDYVKENVADYLPGKFEQAEDHGASDGKKQ